MKLFKKKELKVILRRLLLRIPMISTYIKFRSIPFHNRSFSDYLLFLLKPNKEIYWPRMKTNRVVIPQNIVLGINSSIGGEGCYIQGNGKIIIGNYVRLATNIGILSGNHNPLIHKEQIRKVTIIGDYSWIGMNAIILPGVELGPRTIVGAGSVVTKSFPEGYCVIAGNPARKVKEIDKRKFVPPNYEYQFYGYIPKESFEKFKNKSLKNNN